MNMFFFFMKLPWIKAAAIFIVSAWDTDENKWEVLSCIKVNPFLYWYLVTLAFPESLFCLCFAWCLFYISSLSWTSPFHIHECRCELEQKAIFHDSSLLITTFIFNHSPRVLVSKAEQTHLTSQLDMLCNEACRTLQNYWHPWDRGPKKAWCSFKAGEDI